jgi:WD40 repeat protein
MARIRIILRSIGIGPGLEYLRRDDRDLATGKEQGRVKIDGYGRAVAFSPDGKTLAVSAAKDDKAFVQLFDPVTRTAGTRYALTTPPERLAFSPTGKLIACSNDEFPGRGLDPRTGRVIRDIRTVGADERAAVTPGGRWFWGWDIATGRDRDDQPFDFAPPQESWRWFNRLVAAPDGRPVGAVTLNGVALWDTSDGRFIRYPNDKERWDETIAFSADGRTRVAADHREGRFHFFDARTDGERRMLQLACYDFTPDELIDLDIFTQKIVWLFIDLRWAVTAVCDEVKTTRLLIRDLSGAEPERRLSFSGKVCGWAWPNAVVWVPNVEGTGLAVISAVTGRTRVRLTGEIRWNDPLALSSDGRLLAVFSKETARVDVRETATGRTVATVRTGPVRGMAIAPDSRRLVTAGASGFRVWDLATGEERTAHSSRWRAADQITPGASTWSSRPTAKRPSRMRPTEPVSSGISVRSRRNASRPQPVARTGMGGGPICSGPMPGPLMPHCGGSPKRRRARWSGSSPRG